MLKILSLLIIKISSTVFSIFLIFEVHSCERTLQHFQGTSSIFFKTKPRCLKLLLRVLFRTKHQTEFMHEFTLFRITSPILFLDFNMISKRCLLNTSMCWHEQNYQETNFQKYWVICKWDFSEKFHLIRCG